MPRAGFLRKLLYYCLGALKSLPIMATNHHVHSLSDMYGVLWISFVCVLVLPMFLLRFQQNSSHRLPGLVQNGFPPVSTHKGMT